MTGPPLRWQIVNAIRQWAEERKAPERSRIEAVRALFRAPVIRRKVTPIQGWDRKAPVWRERWRKSA